MRSTPPPQPGNYIGDDPDPPAELGQRLAATAQTTQGVITNYLFYGQRRAADRQDYRLDGLRDHAEHEDDARSQQSHAADELNATTRAARHHVDQTTAPHASTDVPTTTEQQARTTRMRFRIVSPNEQAAKPDRIQPTDVAEETQQFGVDPLAVDSLAADPSRHDPLAKPPVPGLPGHVTLSPEGPERGR